MLYLACARVHSAGAVWFRGGVRGMVSKQEAQAKKEVAGGWAAPAGGVGARAWLQKKGTEQYC